MVECFALCFPNLLWNIKMVTLLHSPAAPFAWWSCGPEMVCNHCNWLFYCSVIWPDSDNSRSPFSLSEILLIITCVSGRVKVSWSDDVVAKHCIGPNTLFCGWRSWYDSIEVGKQCVVREVYKHLVVCFFFKGAAWGYIKSDQGVLACSMFLLEVIVTWYTGLWSHRC